MTEQEASCGADGASQGAGAPDGGHDAGGWAPSHGPTFTPPGGQEPFGGHPKNAPTNTGGAPGGGFSYGAQPSAYPPPGSYPPYGQPGAGPPGYGQPGYGPPAFGQPGAGPPLYGAPYQPGYGTPYQPGYGAYGPSGYGAVGYGAVGYGAVPSPTNGLAIASFVCAVVAVIPWIGLISAVVSIILGFVGRSQIRATGGIQKGAKLAVAGICISFGLFAVWFVIIALFFGRHGA